MSSRLPTFILLALSLLISALIPTFRLFYTANLKSTDFLFVPSPKPPSGIVIIAIDDASLKQIGPWPWPRPTQAQLIHQIMNQNPKVVGYDINVTDPGPNDQEFISTLNQYPNLIVPYSTIGTDLVENIVRSNRTQARLAHVDVITDADGFVRKLPYIKTVNNIEYPSLSFSVAQYPAVVGAAPNLQLIINYHTTPGGFTTVPAADILNNQPHPNLQGKLVLVGITAPDLQDFKPTPVSRKLMSGVEIHASGVNTYLTKQLVYLRPLLQVIGSLLLALLTFAAIYYLRLVKGTLAAIGLIALVIFGTSLAFDSQYILPLFYWLLAIGYSLLMGIIAVSLKDFREKHFLKTAFGKYVAPSILQEILKNPQNLKLGGAKKQITVMFLDIRGFTSFSEKHQPEIVVDKLNHLLQTVSKVIIEHQGTIDKFIGDAVMAFWGAPISDPLQATHALTCALAIKKAIIKTEFKIGLGLNTGEAVVGNIGSLDRFDYTAIGDTVNLASRLESATKEVGHPIILSQNTAKQLNIEHYTGKLKKLSPITVKGKQNKITIYTPT